MPEQPSKPRTGRPPAGVKKVDAGYALKLRLKGLSFRDIGKHVGASHQAVQQAISPLLKRFDPNNELHDYKANSADLFHAVAMESLKAVNADDLAKASLKDKVMAAAIATDKARLISGQSTQNVAVRLAKAVMDAEESDDL